eukprot:CAMPEP_0185306096 /NCGR_PEP_ID=MMETSP1363-20130426/15861_1 /TAXON_ID=38817 /ORGANISM="Gephyrocapsa oceanica, Strain RCC1303" /LENGTH=47 /DNA_ID= /DNA_START= /DNA_END= /DNA_ORIENTATION=
MASPAVQSQSWRQYGQSTPRSQLCLQVAQAPMSAQSQLYWQAGHLPQ